MLSNVLFAIILFIANAELLFLFSGDNNGAWKGLVSFFTSPFLFIALIFIIVRICFLNITSQSKFLIALGATFFLAALWGLLLLTIKTRFFGIYEQDKNTLDALILSLLMLVGYVLLYVYYIKIGNNNLSSEYIIGLSKKYVIGFLVALFFCIPYINYIKSKNEKQLLSNNEVRLSEHIVIYELNRNFESSSFKIKNIEKIVHPSISTNLYRVDGEIENVSESNKSTTGIKNIYYIVDPLNRRVSQINPGENIIWSEYTGNWR